VIAGFGMASTSWSTFISYLFFWMLAVGLLSAKFSKPGSRL